MNLILESAPFNSPLHIVIIGENMKDSLYIFKQLCFNNKNELVKRFYSKAIFKDYALYVTSLNNLKIFHHNVDQVIMRLWLNTSQDIKKLLKHSRCPKDYQILYII